MLIRFTTLDRHDESGHSAGILVVAHTLRDEGDISVAEHDELRLLLRWFNENISVPKVLADKEHRRAISWFKPSATEAIRRMWELKLLLANHGHHVRVLRTAQPGSVVYEDDLQLVAKPPKGVRF